MVIVYIGADVDKLREKFMKILQKLSISTSTMTREMVSAHVSDFPVNFIGKLLKDLELSWPNYKRKKFRTELTFVRFTASF